MIDASPQNHIAPTAIHTSAVPRLPREPSSTKMNGFFEARVALRSPIARVMTISIR